MNISLVLIGPPGSGKTSVGRFLAEQLGLPFRDTDADIEQLAGKSISDIFLDHGEDHFRELECDAVAEAITSHDGILALGGGAVISEKTRALLKSVPVAFLSVGLKAAVDRVGLGVGRPLLAINPRATMRAMLDQRRPWYREAADVEVETDALTIEETATRLAQWLGYPATVRVAGPSPYQVVIGPEATVSIIDHLDGATRAAILHAEPLTEHARRIARFIDDAVDVVFVEVPDAEAGKNIDVAAMCWDKLGETGFTRNDVIIGVGGGAVTDLAGFVAATWLRGVRVLQVPTSLLGMVDAAVGGKTGINTSAGKNLVGAFHEPSVVLCDVDVLETLPERDRIAGMAEIVKCGFIADPEILRMLGDTPSEAADPFGPFIPELIRRSIEVKSSIVSNDLKETGRRAFLNYGHTFAHAIEKVENFTIRHGEAVAIGMVYAAILGRNTGRLDIVDYTRAVLEKIGLPVSYRADRFDQLLAAMRLDKKAVGDTMRFVLLESEHEPRLVDDITIAQLRAAYEEISA